MTEQSPESFLALINRASRGRLKVYLGYAPGVGKTWRMLVEGRDLRSRGIDVVVGVVETHGRTEIARLAAELETIPRRKIEYHGISLDEMDVPAIVARRPQIALVDELAHTNAPGSPNRKRWEDIRDLLAAGINVISTLNVQHLESLYNTIERLTGVVVRERVPDTVLAEADQIVNVDISPEDLRKRLAEGLIYPSERVETAGANYFRAGNLEHLREIAFREIAAQIEQKARGGERASVASTDQVLVCLSSRGPNSALLLRYGSRLAGRLNRDWYALYVQTPREAPTAIDARTQRMLADTLTLANELGATVFTFKGADVVETILRFASEYGIGHIVIGRPSGRSLVGRLLRGKSVAERLVERAKEVSVVVVDTSSARTRETLLPPPAPVDPSPPHAPARPDSIFPFLAYDRIRIWSEAIDKNAAIDDLVATVLASCPKLSVADVRARIDEREAQGSTFLNEGIALPHARIDGIDEPTLALGLPRDGIRDGDKVLPIRLVALLLAPANNPGAHAHLLGEIARFAQDPETRSLLEVARNAEEVIAALNGARARRVRS